MIEVWLTDSMMEVENLDDRERLKEARVESVANHPRKGTLFRGTSEDMERLASDFDARQGGGWDQPLHYSMVARAAAKRIRAAVRAAPPPEEPANNRTAEIVSEYMKRPKEKP